MISTTPNGPLVNPTWSGARADAKLAEAYSLIAEAAGLLGVGLFTGGDLTGPDCVTPASEILDALRGLRATLGNAMMLRAVPR